MFKKVLILIPSFYILALLQTSFFAHFNIAGITPNFILVSVIFIIFFAPASKFGAGVASAFIGGFFLDIFSAKFIGFHVLILVGLAIFIKIILKRYVWTPAI